MSSPKNVYIDDEKTMLTLLKIYQYDNHARHFKRLVQCYYCTIYAQVKQQGDESLGQRFHFIDLVWNRKYRMATD